MAKSKYKAQWDIHHDGKHYAPGKVVELDAELDFGLINSGAVDIVDADGDGEAGKAGTKTKTKAK